MQVQGTSQDNAIQREVDKLVPDQREGRNASRIDRGVPAARPWREQAPKYTMALWVDGDKNAKGGETREQKEGVCDRACGSSNHPKQSNLPIAGITACPGA